MTSETVYNAYIDVFPLYLSHFRDLVQLYTQRQTPQGFSSHKPKSFETFETFGLFTDGGGGWGDPPLAEAGGGRIRVED